MKPLQLASNANGVAQELLLVGIKSSPIFVSSNPLPSNLSCYLSIRFIFFFSTICLRLDPGKLAGSSAPQSVEQLRALVDEGVGPFSLSRRGAFLSSFFCILPLLVSLEQIYLERQLTLKEILPLEEVRLCFVYSPA